MQKSEEPLIPKTINYCWFGKNDKNPLLLKCIESWKRFFPDYQIVEWNEDNFDVNIIEYTKEAYSAKKWAFVSDYARLYIIYHHGGIYFDTDVEVLKNFSFLLKECGYLCFENTTNEPDSKTIATGLGFAAEPKNEIIKALMEDYHGLHFVGEDGELDMTPCPIRNTRVLKKMGIKTDGTMQKIGNIIIYPFDYFCGVDIANSHIFITENTYTIHHYSATWKEEAGRWISFKYGILIPGIQKILGISTYDWLKKTISTISSNKKNK